MVESSSFSFVVYNKFWGSEWPALWKYITYLDICNIYFRISLTIFCIESGCQILITHPLYSIAIPLRFISPKSTKQHNNVALCCKAHMWSLSLHSLHALPNSPAGCPFAHGLGLGAGRYTWVCCGVRPKTCTKQRDDGWGETRTAVLFLDNSVCCYT